jgi:hypothetical protein
MKKKLLYYCVNILTRNPPRLSGLSLNVPRFFPHPSSEEHTVKRRVRFHYAPDQGGTVIVLTHITGEDNTNTLRNTFKRVILRVLTFIPVTNINKLTGLYAYFIVIEPERFRRVSSVILEDLRKLFYVRIFSGTTINTLKNLSPLLRGFVRSFRTCSLHH